MFRGCLSVAPHRNHPAVAFGGGDPTDCGDLGRCTSWGRRRPWRRGWPWGAAGHGAPLPTAAPWPTAASWAVEAPWPARAAATRRASPKGGPNPAARPAAIARSMAAGSGASDKISSARAARAARCCAVTGRRDEFAGDLRGAQLRTWTPETPGPTPAHAWTPHSHPGSTSERPHLKPGLAAYFRKFLAWARRAGKMASLLALAVSPGRGDFA